MNGTGDASTWTAMVSLALVATLAACVSVGTDGRLAVGSGLIAAVTAAYTIGRWTEYRLGVRTRAARRIERPVEDVLGEALVRCRRFERPLALVRIGVVDSGARGAIVDQVRTTDEVCHDAEATYVLMPEESEIGAMAWIARLRRTLALPDIAIAQFPVDGLTVDALLRHAASPDGARRPAGPDGVFDLEERDHLAYEEHDSHGDRSAR